MKNQRLEDATSQCIRCGFCLEACPTFVLTGDERESPRGRISLARAVNEGVVSPHEIKDSFDHCLGCLACETACPSGVPFHTILEETRHTLIPTPMSFKNRLMLGILTNRARLKMLLPVAKLSSQMPKVEPLGAWSSLPPIPENQAKESVVLLRGCAARVLYPRNTFAATRLLKRAGLQVIDAKQECCGSLDSHFGETETGYQKATKLLESSKPHRLVTTSAGCGFHLQQLSEPGAVVSLPKLLADTGFEEKLAHANQLKNLKVTYHDACHLINGQKISEEPRRLIRAIPGIDFVELPEANLCCGSAGIYNILQPEMANRLLDRKWENIRATKADIVVSANPGCHSWIAKRTGAHVMQLEEFLESAFSGLPQP